MNEIQQLQDQLDLNRDEFARIAVMAKDLVLARVAPTTSASIFQLCERSQQVITQKVSVIAQRDEWEAKFHATNKRLLDAEADLAASNARAEQYRVALVRLNQIYRSEQDEPGIEPDWLRTALSTPPPPVVSREVQSQSKGGDEVCAESALVSAIPTINASSTESKPAASSAAPTSDPLDAATPRTDAATHDDWSGGAEATEPEVCRAIEKELTMAREVLRLCVEALQARDTGSGWFNHNAAKAALTAGLAELERVK